MSLDNVLTVAGAAHGNIALLVFGLALSIPLLFIGAGLIALATDKLPLIIYLGSALIFRIAVVLIVDDKLLHEHLTPNLVLRARAALAGGSGRPGALHWAGAPARPAHHSALDQPVR